MEAVRSFEAASAQFAEINDDDGQVEADCHAARAYVAMGHYAKALDLLQNAVNHIRPVDKQVQAMLLGTLGRVYHLTGHSESAVNALEAGIEIAKREKNDHQQAAFLNTLGTVHAVSDRDSMALSTYVQAVAAARRAGAAQLTATVEINAARVLLKQGSAEAYEKALLFLQEASDALRSLGDSNEKAFALINVGRQYTLAEKNESAKKDPNAALIDELRRKAFDAFLGAEKIADVLGLAVARSYAVGYRGGLYEETGKYEEAQQLTRQAIFWAQQERSAESLYLWQWQNGRLMARTATLDDAIAAYRRAIYTLETIRADLSVACNQGNRLSFRDTVGPLYFELADLLLRRSATRQEDRQRQHDLLDAQNTVEQLKAVELQDYFQDECVTALQSKAAGLEQIAEKTAAIYPILLPDRTELLVTLSDGLYQFTVDAGSDQITREIRQLRTKLQRPGSRYIRHAKRLYGWLIQPIEDDLKAHDIQTLVIVPDGPLRTVPLSVLNDGRQFLVERFSLVTTPGLTLTDPHPIPRENLQLLVGGLTEAVQGFSALPNVDYELKRLQELYQCDLLRNENFSIDGMTRSLQSTPFPIVHIASHGQFDRDPEKTFLLTYREKLSMGHLQELMGLGQYRDEPVELLTLSACQTAAGDDRAALGLAGVAIKSGARSALATLWFINDEATSRLVSMFYEQLQDPALSKAQALQQAQLKLMAVDQFRHPAFWAPFLLIGNWL